MNNSRRYRGDNQYQEVQGTRSFHKKPPVNGNWKPTVPSWEKEFCCLGTSRKWHKILEAQKFMFLYDNIVQWKDSACEEAFHDAKRRYWADLNGLPCDIPLPGPDIHIDEIDWNSKIDPELYLDLYREPKYPDENDQHEPVLIFSAAFLAPPFDSGTGWGDAEEYLQKAATGWGAAEEDLQKAATGWGEAEEDLQKAATGGLDPTYDAEGINVDPQNSNVSQSNGAIADNGLANIWRDSDGWYNQWDNVNPQKSNVSQSNGAPLDNGLANIWKDSDGWDNQWDNRWDNQWRGGGQWGMLEGYSRRGEGTDWCMSRYKTSRFNGDGGEWGMWNGNNNKSYQTDRRRWRNGRGRKRMNFIF
ncbi:uncharacterized protein [Euphorbia lathyris]|uniref:uncharacterized protein isoform X2 n=1 Tax=Euphorbia lathyris TaxID=212925 RepID=UPI003313B69C